MRNLLIFSACIAALAAPAEATIRVATYTGTIADSYDQTGLFGAAGGTLDGMSFVLKFTYDTSLGSRYNPSWTDSVSGGTDLGTTSPILVTTLKINGITQLVGGATNGSALVQGNIIGHYSGYSGVSSLIEEDDFATADSGVASAPASLDADVAKQPAINGVGTFSFTIFQFSNSTYWKHTYGTFIPSSVSVGGVTAFVPEPASWLLMIAGFGLVGIAVRNRRKALAAA